MSLAMSLAMHLAMPEVKRIPLIGVAPGSLYDDTIMMIMMVMMIMMMMMMTSIRGIVCTSRFVRVILAQGPR